MDKYSFRFSPLVFEELRRAFQYWIIHHNDASIHVFLLQIRAAFDAVCLHPEMKQVVSFETKGDSEYRRVNGWYFAFLYRIDEDRLFHERSGR